MSAVAICIPLYTRNAASNPDKPFCRRKIQGSELASDVSIDLVQQMEQRWSSARLGTCAYSCRGQLSSGSYNGFFSVVPVDHARCSHDPPNDLFAFVP